MAPRVWLITGASSGFGRDMTELVLKKGEIAIATLRKPEVLHDLKAKYPADKLITIKLDVNNAQEIKEVFAKAKTAFGRIDVVFNNAGWAILGEGEATPEDEARRLFDTNFWGATNVSREAVRFFREENKPSGGLLLNNSSVSGVKAVPGMAYYSASKHALEGFTQALASELDPEWNIKISLVEPGSFVTAIANNMSAENTPSAYSNPNLPGSQVRQYLTKFEQVARDSAKGVQRIYDLSLVPNPPLRFPLGPDAVDAIKQQVKLIEQDVVKYESWSEGLEFDK